MQLLNLGGDYYKPAGTYLLYHLEKQKKIVFTNIEKWYLNEFFLIFLNLNQPSIVWIKQINVILAGTNDVYAVM